MIAPDRWRLDALLVLLLIALAWTTSGLIQPATALAAALSLALVAGIRATLLRGRRPRWQRYGVLAGSGGAALGGALLLQEAAGSGIQWEWQMLVILPVLVHALWPREDGAGEWLDERRSVLLLCVSLGLWWARPWEQRLGQILLALLLLALVGSLVGVQRRQSLWRRQALVGDASPHGAARVIGLALALAVACLLITAGLVAAVGSMPRPWSPRSPETPAAAPADLQPVQLGIREPELYGRIAEVRVLDRAGRSIDWPNPLYLRAMVLDRLVVDEKGLYFTRGLEDPRRFRDAEDGRSNGRIDLRRGEAAEARAGMQLEIRIEAEELRLLPIHPQLAWLEVDEVELLAGQAFRRPIGPAQERIRMACDARSYFGAELEDDSRAVPAMPVTAPALAEDEMHLQTRVDSLLSGVDGDWNRARRLQGFLQQTGTLDEEVSWPGSYEAFLQGERRGNSSYFSQLYAVMAQLAGMHCRVAVGFRSNHFRPREKKFEVYAADYGFWAEVEFEGHGWVCIDPSPTPVPAAVPDEPEVAPREPDVGAAEGREPDPLETEETPSEWLGFLVLVLLAALALWPVTRRSRRRGPRAAPPGTDRAPSRSWKYWQRYVDACAAAGFPKPPGQTASEFAAGMSRLLPGEARQTRMLRDCYLTCRFGARPLSAEHEAHLRAFLRGLPGLLRRRREELNPRVRARSARGRSTR